VQRHTILRIKDPAIGLRESGEIHISGTESVNVLRES